MCRLIAVGVVMFVALFGNGCCTAECARTSMCKLHRRLDPCPTCSSTVLTPPIVIQE